MVRSSLVAGALLTAMLAAGHSQAAPTAGDPDPTVDVIKAQLQLAQGGAGGAGGGGGGDSAGRGADTSKGAVPKNPPEFPTGLGNPGTAPVPPSPSNPAGTTVTGSGSSSAPGAGGSGEGTTAPGTGLGSPGTTQQGGKTRPEQ
jgi:hypothetical protein